MPVGEHPHDVSNSTLGKCPGRDVLAQRRHGQQSCRRVGALMAAESNRLVSLDLADMTLVDREAITFLASAEAAGAVLVNCPEYVRSWIDAEQSGAYERVSDPRRVVAVDRRVRVRGSPHIAEPHRRRDLWGRRRNVSSAARWREADRGRARSSRRRVGAHSTWANRPGVGVNSGWSWHLENVEFVEVAIELCDGRPSDVERQGTQFGGGRFCPWGARVLAIGD
jgi:hypothetical protein